MTTERGMDIYLDPGRRLPDVMRKQIMNHIYLGQWELAAATLRTLRKHGERSLEGNSSGAVPGVPEVAGVAGAVSEVPGKHGSRGARDPRDEASSSRSGYSECELLDRVVSQPAGMSYGSESLPSPYHLAWLAKQLRAEITDQPSSVGQDCELNLLLYDLKDHLSPDLIKNIHCLCQPWKDPYHTALDLLLDIKPLLQSLLRTNLPALRLLATAFIQWCPDDIIAHLHDIFLDFTLQTLENKNDETESEDQVYDLLWLVAQFDLGYNESKMINLVSKLEFLDQSRIFSCTVGIKGELTLRTYLKYLKEKRSKTDIVSCGKEKFWREMYLYCEKENSHFVEIIMDTALAMIRDDQFLALAEFLSLPWLRRLRPYLLLMGWRFCGSCDKADRLIKTLYDETEPCDVLVQQACRKLLYQVNLVKWCLEKARPLVSASGTTPDRVASMFQGLEVNSPLVVLHQSTKLSSLDRAEVLNLLNNYPARQEDSALAKEEVRFHDNSNTAQESTTDQSSHDTATYCAFNVLTLFTDALCQCGHFDISTQTSQEDLQRLYQEKVWDVLCLAGKYLSELIPLDFRLEIMENAFSLLFVRNVDMKQSESDIECDDVITEDQYHEKTRKWSDSRILEGADFVANQYFVRDLLHVLKECLQKLEQDVYKTREEVNSGESVTSRLQKLRQHVSEAGWRCSLVESGDVKPGHVIASANHNASDDTNSDEDMEEVMCRRRRTSSPRHKGYRRRISSSSSRRSSSQKWRHRSILTKMLSPPASLLNLCLRRGKFAQARTVVTMLSLENSPEAGEVDLAELYHSKSGQIQSLDRKTAAQSSVSSLSKPVTALVEELFTADDIPSTHAQKLPLMALDFAFTSCRTLDSTRSMIELARNKAGSESNLVSFTEQMMELLHHIDEITVVCLQRFRNSVEVLNRANLPINSEDCKKYLDSISAIDQALTKVSTILTEKRTEEKEAFLNKMRGEDLRPEKKSDPRTLHNAMKQLIRVTSEEFPKSGILDCFGCQGLESDKQFLNYLVGLYEHVKLLSAIMLESEMRSKTVVVVDDYYKMLLDSPTAIFGKLMFEKKMSPYRLEKFAGKLNLDLVQIIVSSCCPEVESHVIEISQPEMDFVGGKFLLNGGKCGSMVEKRPDVLAAEILTKVVKVMKTKVKSLHIGTTFTSQHAQSSWNDGDVIDILNQSRELRNCDLDLLVTFNEKCSFFCNLCNLLNIHTTLYCRNQKGNPYSQIQRLTLFGYQVGQLGIVNQLELRYLIMRSDLPKPNSYNGTLDYCTPKLDKNDVWYKLSPPPEPRLLFSLVDGCLGSPPLHVLTTELVQQQLQQSMTDYLQYTVHVDTDRETVLIPELLLWYRTDFVGEEHEHDYEGLLNFVSAQTTQEEGEKIRELLNLEREVPDSLDEKRVNFLPFQTSVAAYDYDFGYRFEYSQHFKTHRRVSSLPADYETLDTTGSLVTSSVTSSQKVYNLRTVTLEYVKSKNPLIATLVSLVCSDDLDDIEEGFTDDFYNDSTEGTGSPAKPKLTTQYSQSDISLVDVRSYRYQKLQTDFTRLQAHLMQNVLPIFGSDVIMSADPILKFVSNPIDKPVRRMILARQDSPEFLTTVRRILEKLAREEKWLQVIRLVNNLAETVVDAYPDLGNARDWALCCAALAPGAGSAWRYLVQVRDRARLSRVVLGCLDRWPVDVCVRLLEVCLASRDLPSGVTDVLRQRLDTMRVYKKIAQCAARVRESEPSEVLTDLVSHWRAIVRLTNYQPQDVMHVLLRCHEFSTARAWASSHHVNADIRMIIEESHIKYLLEKDESRTIDAYLEYESFLSSDEDFCQRVCDRILTTCYRENVVLFVSRFVLSHLDHRLSPGRREELIMMGMGAKALLTFAEPLRAEYCQLISRPLLLVEQLLMNMQVDLVKKTLEIVKAGVEAHRADIRLFSLSDLDLLLVRYATKAVEFPVVETGMAGLDESFSLRSQSRMSQFPDDRCQSRMSQYPDERCQSRMSQGPGGEDRRRKRSTVSMCEPVYMTGTDDTFTSTTTTGSSLPSDRSPAQRGTIVGTGFVMPLSAVPREQWVPDLSVKLCMCCNNERFSMFNRRHHCRRCGRVVCGSCSNKTTLILGQQQRTCADCYSQTFRGTEHAQDSLHTRIMGKLSGVTSLTSSTDSGSPPDPARVHDAAYVNYLPLEFTWKLSLDEDLNHVTRQDFYYEHAPSTSLCFSLLELHSQPAECGQHMLLLCDDLSKLLKTVTPGGAAQEVDYNLVISMMKYLLFNAKLKFLSCNDTSGIARCDQYLSRVDLMQLLVSSNCRGIPSIHELTKLDTVRRLRDRLIEEERLSLAMEVSTKSGLDASGVWAAWGTACLHVNNLNKARTMFSRCMKPPVDKNQSSVNKLLADITETLETSRSRLEFRLPASTAASHGEMSDERFNECVYYLKTYGSHLSLVNFYRRHGYWQKAAKYILDKRCVNDVFVEGLLVPALRNEEFALLEDQLLIIDPSLEAWIPYLTAGCRYLQKSRYSNVLYSLQVFMKDYIRAAMSCIHVYYLRHARTYTDLLSRVHHLITAREHLDTYLRQEPPLSLARPAQSSSPAPDWVARSPLADRAEKMPAHAVHKHIKTIMLQIDVTKLLCEAQDSARSSASGSDVTVAENDVTRPEDDVTLGGAMGGEPSSRKLVTLFGNNKERSQVAVMVIEAAPESEHNFSIGCRIIVEYRLSPSLVFSQVVRRLAKLSLFPLIRHFLQHVQTSGLCDDQTHDEIVGACVRVLADRTDETKEAESLIKQIKLDSNRINAYILCGKLKQAYLIAVKRGSAEDVQMIAGAAQRSGQTAVHDICLRFLQQRQQQQ